MRGPLTTVIAALGLSGLPACAQTLPDPAPVEVAAVPDTPSAAALGWTPRDAHRVYEKGRDARADVEAALARAMESRRRVLVVFGANWCHDSRGFAGHLERPEIAALVADSFEVVYVDVGSPQTGDGVNLDLAADLGQPEVVGTPTVVLLDVGGARINTPETATAWRNSDSRTPEEVLEELTRYRDWGWCYPMPGEGPDGIMRAPDCSAHSRP